nr:hypothetical protein [uncultured archaeon]
MTYQIPQQLEYKERIMFGLTFKQLAYGLLFGIIALVFFKILPSGLNFVLAVLVSCVGTGFMFFDFSMHIKNYWYYYKSRKISLNESELNAFIGIKKIEDSVIINSQNKKVAILRVNPINFSIKLPEEKESIMLAFQKFLNSLDFPTQIIMNTESLDLKDYLSSLKSRLIEKSYGDIFESYKNYLNGVITSKKIMNRVFYLVIPEQNDIEIQVNICIERFNSLNLKVERLNNKQLQELILKFIPKKQDNQKKFIEINNNINHLDINKSFYRVIYASGYPRTVEPGFLDRIVSLLGDFNLSLQIKPYPIEHMLVDLNKELQKQRADLYAMQSKGIINPSLEIQYNDTRSTLETLQKGDERLFNISLYVTCKADSVSDLDLLTKKVEAELNSIMILPKVAKFRMIQGFKSVLPLGMDEVKVNRNITTRALSAFFPFTSQFLQADNTGVWLGLNKNNIPIIKDIFKLSNPNGVVLAQSGGGKSYFCKLLITRYLLNGTKVIIIDPQGEYKALVKRFGGQIIDLSRESNTLINPLDLMGHDYTEKRLSLMDLMPVMLGGLSEPQKAFLDKAITNAYADKGINMISDTWSNEPPIMEDLLESLTKLVKKATQIENATLRSVINRLDMYVSGVFSFLNKHTNLKFNNNLVCFDLGNMPKQIKPVVMFLVLDYVYMKMKSDISRKILLVDEAWSLLSRTEDAGYILEIVKTCRKFNMGLLLINQEVEDLFNSRAGKSVLANSAYTMLLKQKPSVIKNICEAFHLSPSEREHLLTANIGEGLLIMEDEHSKIKVVASPEENEIITTNADEILDKKVVEKRNNGGASINVDLDKRFYKEKELNKDEVKYLINEGYKLFSQKSIVSGKQEDYILKPRHNESLNHMFVIYDIVDYLKLRGINAEMYTTRMPDIVFSHNGKRYAIEIETGINLKKDRKMIAEKVRNLNSKYDDWFFVVTNRNLVKSYKTFGETLDSRFILRKLKNLLK